MRVENSRSEDATAFWDWNLVTNRVHFSPRWLSLIGCDGREPSRTPEAWFERVHPDDLAELLDDLQRLRAEGERCSSRHRVRHQDGLYRWMECRVSVVRNRRREAIRLTGVHRDVTADTMTDPATGLPNRLLLWDRISHAIRGMQDGEDSRFAVLVVDVRRVARADLEAGDNLPVMAGVARRLETGLRIQDGTLTNGLVARLNGEQFGILLGGLPDLQDATVVAHHMLSELRAPLDIKGSQIFLSVSVGIAVSATGYVSPDDMVRDAGTAAHRARLLGGGHSEVFDTVAVRTQQVERRLEQDLSQALDEHEFQLAYQPIITLDSQRIVGFEALLRWRHPALGVISPADFIPIAERTGVIGRLGRWVIEQACLRLKAWQDLVPATGDLWISVNLSGAQLKQSDLHQQIADAIRTAAVAPHNLILELTESVAVGHGTSTKTQLMQLRALGVRISIDDFGTGYSSLAHIRELPVDMIKIDQSFVRGMETDGEAAAIVGTLTRLAQQLSLEVIVEGIENEEQLLALRGLHCESVQGYLFAKPLDARAALDMLRTGRLILSPVRSETPARRTQDDDDLALVRPQSVWSSKRLGLAASLGVLALVGTTTGWLRT